MRSAVREEPAKESVVGLTADDARLCIVALGLSRPALELLYPGRAEIVAFRLARRLQLDRTNR